MLLGRGAPPERPASAVPAPRANRARDDTRRVCHASATAVSHSLAPSYSRQADKLLAEARDGGRSAGEGLRVANELGAHRNAAHAIGFFWQLGLKRAAIESLMCKSALLVDEQSYDNARSRVGCLAAELGLSQPEVGKVLNKRPQLLHMQAERSLPERVAFLLENGVPEHKLGTLVRKAPQVLELGVERTLQPRVDFLKGLGLTNEAVGKVISREPSLLIAREQACQRRVNFLSSEGFSNDDIVKLVCSHPAVLRYTVEALRERLDFLHAAGMSTEEVVKTATGFAGIFSLSVERSLKPKLEYLTSELLRDVHSVVSYPSFWSLSLDGRIRPRHLYALSYGGPWLETEPMAFDLFKCTDRAFVRRVMPSNRGDIDAELQRYLQLRQTFLSAHDKVTPVNQKGRERADSPGAEEREPVEEQSSAFSWQRGHKQKQKQKQHQHHHEKGNFGGGREREGEGERVPVSERPSTLSRRRRQTAAAS